MKISSQKLFLGIVILVLIILVILILNIKKEETTGLVTELKYEAEGFPVQVIIISPMELEKSFSLSGSTQAQRDVTLLSKVGGDVLRICVKMGDAFQQGDTLVELDHTSASHIFSQSQAALLAAEADYNAVLNDIKRFERLFQQGSVSIKELQDMQMTEVKMRSGEIAAKAAKDIAWKNLQDCTITAPFDGFAGEIFIEQGDNTMPGQPIVRVLDLDTILIEVGFTADEVNNISRGKTVSADFHDYVNFSVNGYIDSFSPAADQSGTYSAKIILPNRRLTIKPGWMAKIHIVSHKYENIIAIPRSSVIEREVESIVFIASKGLARQRTIETGDYNDELIEVKSGLALSDTLIIMGQTTLKDSSLVVITNLPY